MLAELYVLSGRDAGKLIDAVGPTIFLGRAATNHYRIRDPQASRVHCRIDITTNGLTLADTGSGNGTYLNEERVEGVCELADGDEIRVGATRLKILIETPSDQCSDDDSREDSLAESTLVSADFAESRSEAVAGSNLAAARAPEPAPVEGPERSDTPPPARAKARKRRRKSPSSKGQAQLRDVIPGYRLQRRLGGHGHQGIAVYRAVQASLDRQVALKVFLPRGNTRPEDVERFLREAKAIARLPHPNIVTVHDVISRGRMRVIVTEYLAGGSAADRLDSGPMDLEGALDIAEGVARALGYLHNQGIAHRNVKPSNILLDRELPTYKLAGFGFATGPAVQAQGDTCFLDSEPKGFAFLAPEQLRADLSGVGPWTDVYSLGATLFACLSAHPPFEAENSVALAAMVLNDPAPALEGVDPAVARIVARCLEKEPGDRYPDANELLHELGAYRSTLSATE